MTELLINAFVAAIEGGTMTIDNVPEVYRGQVQELLKDNEGE